MTEAVHLIATRAGYDAMAEEYAGLFRTALDEAPLDRALLSGFAETVRRDHADPQLLEVGSGPGTVAAHLHRLGLPVRGIDLSPAMVELALADASVTGVVAWYSLIHVPAAHRPE